MKVEWLEVGINVLQRGNRHTSYVSNSIHTIHPGQSPGVIRTSGISVDGSLDGCVWARIACLQLVVAASFKESKVSTVEFSPSNNSWKNAGKSLWIP